MSDINKIHCGHCEETYYSLWGETNTVCHSPLQKDASLTGTLFGAICPRCGMPTLQYAHGQQANTNYTEDALAEFERVTVFPDQSDHTLEVVITIVIEFESFRKETEEGTGLTAEEKREYRKRPDIVEKARKLIEMAIASASGSAAGTAIAGFLGSL